MKTTIIDAKALKTTITDVRINRDLNFGKYRELAQELVLDATGFAKEFGGGTMTWNYYESSAYPKGNYDDIRVDIHMDFNTNTAEIEWYVLPEEPEWHKKLK